MAKYSAILGVLVGAMGVALLAGCGEESAPSIQITTNHAAGVQIPDRIHALAVSDFKAAGGVQERWAAMAADKLSSALDEANRASGRFTLIDRKGLKSILNERDLQTAFSDPDAASKHAGELKAVDAIIYGNVTAAENREMTEQKTTIDFATQRPKTVNVTKLYCHLAVSFTVVNVTNGSTIRTKTFDKDYDSSRDDKKGVMDFVAPKGAEKPAEQALTAMMDKAVREFVADISPHSETHKVRLAGGKSQLVKDGNKLAAEGDFKAALEVFAAAGPDDDAAMFNAGVMCEKLGDYPKALDYYNKAIAQKKDSSYIQARVRVQRASEK